MVNSSDKNDGDIAAKPTTTTTAKIVLEKYSREFITCDNYRFKTDIVNGSSYTCYNCGEVYRRNDKEFDPEKLSDEEARAFWVEQEIDAIRFDRCENLTPCLLNYCHSWFESDDV